MNVLEVDPSAPTFLSKRYASGVKFSTNGVNSQIKTLLQPRLLKTKRGLSKELTVTSQAAELPPISLSWQQKNQLVLLFFLCGPILHQPLTFRFFCKIERGYPIRYCLVLQKWTCDHQRPYRDRKHKRSRSSGMTGEPSHRICDPCRSLGRLKLKRNWRNCMWK